MVTEEISEAVRDYLKVLPSAGIHPTGAILFGSQSNGTATEWSDIDLVVIAPEFDDATDHDLESRMWRSLVHADVRIEPIACGTQEWANGTIRPIIEIARAEGVLITPRQAA